jgi:predicted hydrolase (HD superfamily)
VSFLNHDLGYSDKKKSPEESGLIRAELARRQTREVQDSIAAAPSVRTGQRVNHLTGKQPY